jgi:hypothetical protein
MNLRLWRRIRIAPGVTLNLSNTGPSISFGVRGAHVTYGRRGRRATIGAPGTGLYLTEVTPYRRRASSTARVLFWAVVGIVLAALMHGGIR